MSSPFDPCFDAEIEELLAAQERFDAIRRDVALRTGRQLCDLAYANPYDGAPRVVRDALRDAIELERSLDLQYTPYGGSTLTRRLVAQSLSRARGARFPWRSVVLTPGASAALNVALRVLSRKSDRDEVLIVTPCWLDTPLYARNLGFEPVLVPVDRETMHLDLGAIEAALGERTRAVVLSQPANPSGVVYGREELDRLGELMRRTASAPLLISDECHRDFVPEDRFVSPDASYDATCIVYSFGKRIFAQGQRIGYAAPSPRMTRSDEFARQMERACRVMGFSTPTALMQTALRKLIDHPVETDVFDRRRERAIASLRASGYALVPGDGTFFLYPETPAGEDDFDFVERAGKRGVLVLPAPLFHDSGHFRISLTCDDAMLERALEHLEALR